MKTVRNTTQRPVRVPLAGGKVLHLGPKKEGQVSEESLSRPAFRKLVEAKTLEIVDAVASDGVERTDSSHVRGTAQGHHKSSTVKSKGDR